MGELANRQVGAFGALSLQVGQVVEHLLALLLLGALLLGSLLLLGLDAIAAFQLGLEGLNLGILPDTLPDDFALVVGCILTESSLEGCIVVLRLVELASLRHRRVLGLEPLDHAAELLLARLQLPLGTGF